MEEYPANSRVSRDAAVPKPVVEEPKIEPVVAAGTVKRRKKPIGQRLRETFIGGDANSVMGYIMAEVVVPAVKDTISEMASQFFERMLFGESRGPSRRSHRGTGNANYVSYNRFSPSSPVRQEQYRPSMTSRDRANHNFDQIILPDRPSADQVLDRMYDLLSRYEHVTVANLYELVGVTGDFTDNNWGWVSLEGSNVRRVREGFLIELPRPEPLRR